MAAIRSISELPIIYLPIGGYMGNVLFGDDVTFQSNEKGEPE